ncbi:SMP-30/gluconolactonase/LRE family protein [Leptospira perolatii]|uniref:SMP-30/gluconolactonase/LRE family protein n=1 Tax=Leptospira perolatii TaxID=2023191 RepID=UPI0013FE358B|nr:SMP-30/gluconolactonase/LRE family protein [Leptospira perolatii]
MNQKRVLLLTITILLSAIIVIAIRPVSIDPVAYFPPEAPELIGPYLKNSSLNSAELIALGKIHGPEDIEIDEHGNLYSASSDGKIYKISQDGEMIAHALTGGRPLGLKYQPDGTLFVADGIKGLLKVSRKGGVEILSTAPEGGEPFLFVNDLDVSSDGTVYFSDASSKFRSEEYLYDLMEGVPHGRLMKYDPREKRSTVLVKDLFFANGVALSANEDFLLVNETYKYRIHRYWLKGPKAGTSEVWVENLPGFPDNISSDRKGHFYLALFTVRDSFLDKFLHPRPWAKLLIAKLPKFLWPKPEPYGFAALFDEEGHCLVSFQEPTGEHLKEITSVKRNGNFIYLGSLHNDRIGKFLLPESFREK